MVLVTLVCFGSIWIVAQSIRAPLFDPKQLFSNKHDYTFPDYLLKPESHDLLPADLSEVLPKISFTSSHHAGPSNTSVHSMPGTHRWFSLKFIEDESWKSQLEALRLSQEHDVESKDTILRLQDEIRRLEMVGANNKPHSSPLSLTNDGQERHFGLLPSSSIWCYGENKRDR